MNVAAVLDSGGTVDTARLVGRDRELAALDRLIGDVLGGTGAMLLMSGEAGMGKSTLARAAARQAAARGLRTVWGRCWETGGAPVYWPVIQVLRTLVDDLTDAQLGAELGPLAGEIARVLPELRVRAPELSEAPEIGGAEARFRLFDAVAGFLARSARRHPLLLLFDDLHAADRASLELLDFVARTLDDAPLAVLGAYRESDARISGLSEALVRLRRTGTQLTLSPLSHDAIRKWLSRDSAPVAAEALDALVDRSEGNPLFVEELARQLDAGAAAVPEGIAALFRQRLEPLPELTRDALGVASVLGRDPDPVLLGRLLQATPSEAMTALEPAHQAGLLIDGGDRGPRFCHVLLREALHRELTPARRFELHRRAADALVELAAADERATELAHHLCEAGPAAAAEAVQRCERAAEQAAHLFAFDEAVVLYERALELQIERAPADRAGRFELLLAVGRARILAGDEARGQDACAAAAAIARAVGDPVLLARAVLELAAPLSFASVDGSLGELLREALDALPGDERPLRAQLMARLAAAEQPALDARGPIARAHAAIALAREHGDDAVLLTALRYGISAMMDLEEPRVRAELNREHVELARRLGQQGEVLRGAARLAFDYVESGDLFSTEATIEAHARAAEAAGHPYYRWQSLSLHAMLAIVRGDFARATDQHERARALAPHTGSPQAARYSEGQALGLLRARYDDATLASLLESTRTFAVLQNPLGRLFTGSFLAHLERVDELRALFVDAPPPELAASIDVHILTAAAEIAYALDDAALGRLVQAPLERMAERNASWGLVCMNCDAPVTRSVALALVAQGEHAAADGRFAEAAERARALGMRPSLARVRYEQGCVRQRAGDDDGAGACFVQARALAVELGMAGLVARVDRRQSTRAADAEGAHVEATDASDSEVAALRRDGDGWEVRHGTATFTLRDSKGLQILSRMLDEPGREFHVLQLIEGGGGVDTGDAGELLDARAQAAYRERATQLRAELDEAERWNDAGRVERTRTELDALTRELARATGLGGRARAASSSAERARTNVQKRIRHALGQIEAHSPELARYLDRTVRTGVFCCYEPLRVP